MAARHSDSAEIERLIRSKTSEQLDTLSNELKNKIRERDNAFREKAEMCSGLKAKSLQKVKSRPL